MKINTPEQLRVLYGFPRGRAKDKVQISLDKHSINFIEKSPFLMLSSVDKHGKMDASPRGGQVGFIKMLNTTTIVIPDSKGNNRLDSLINIIETGTIGTLFLIPGVDETLRINGRAYISSQQDHLELFTSEKNPPKACIILNIEEVFLHCAKALMRSRLWDKNAKIERREFPTMGEMLKDQLGGNDVVETQVEMEQRYQKDL